MLSSCLQDVVTLGRWMDPIHLCHGISGASVDRAAAVLGAGAREARIWHCSWTTGAMLHVKVSRTWLKIWVGGICNSVCVQPGKQNRRMDSFMQDLSPWTPLRYWGVASAHWVRLWMLVFLPLSSYESPSNHSCHGQVVTLLYIGGASSTSGLLSCQETDGAGETWQHFLWGGGRVR